MASILVVDDSRTVAGALAAVLKKHHHAVHVAHDGLAALNALYTQDLDLAVLDVRLPHVDGFQLCSAIRASQIAADMPIIMVSGLTKSITIQHALKLGANKYICKPVDDEQFINTVNELLDDALVIKAHGTSQPKSE